MSKSTPLVEPSFVGREKELQELKVSLESAVEGKGKTVFLSGEAGVGKSRLAAEFLADARKHGFTTLKGWCLSNAAVPYFPFFEAFNAFFSYETQDAGIAKLEIRDLLSGSSEFDLKRGSETVSAQVWKDQTFMAVAKTLSKISNHCPVILFIDDAHWADSASLSLIHYLARVIGSFKILLIVSFRSENLPSGSEDRSNPLVETLRLMRREDLVSEIKVGALDLKGVLDVTTSMLGVVPPLELAKKLAEESQGNPLFVVESLRMLNERGGLVRDGNNWRLAEEELGIPPKIKDIILQRLSLLLHGQRKVLDAASVIGEMFDVGLLSSVLGMNQLEIIETLDAIEKNSSLVSCEGELYRFDHARSREAIYDELSSALKKAYHAKVADTLETATVEGKRSLSDLAYHFAKAGNREKAVKFALIAGQNALARWSNTEAIENFSFVVEATDGDSQRNAERESAIEGLGDAYYASSLYKEASRFFVQLADCTQNGVTGLRALRKAIMSVFVLGETSYLIELVKKAEGCPVPNRLENARILLCKGNALISQNMYGIASGYSQEALQVFEEEYSLSDVASALSRGVPHTVIEPVEGLTEILRSLALYEEFGDVSQQMLSSFLVGLSFQFCSLWNEALDMFARVTEIYERTKFRNYPQLVDSYTFSSMIITFRGNVERALQYCLKALDISSKTDSLASQGAVYGHLVVLYTRLGDLKLAQDYYEKLLRLPPEILSHRFVPILLAKAVYFAGKHQWEDSNQYFKEIFERQKARRMGSSNLRAHSLYYHSWVLTMQGKSEEAEAELKQISKISQEADEKFEHSNLQAHIMAKHHVVVGEEFEMRFDLINVGRKQCTVLKIEDFVPTDFDVISLPSFCSQQNFDMCLTKKSVDPFKVETIKAKIKVNTAGTYVIHSKATYLDDLENVRTIDLNQATIIVDPAPISYQTLPERMSTGWTELDELLFGGLPERFAVALTARSSGEREYVIRRFLEKGNDAGEPTFYLTAEAKNLDVLLEKHHENTVLVLCNPLAGSMMRDLPNVFRLKGIENLTDIDIALNKAFRSIKSSTVKSRRICIDLLSDVLLLHHAVNTRRWVSSLLSVLKLQGFTTLAVIDPSMHSPEELQAVLSVFDGEILITDRETVEGTKSILKIKKLINQKYSDKEIFLQKIN